MDQYTSNNMTDQYTSYNMTDQYTSNNMTYDMMGSMDQYTNNYNITYSMTNNISGPPGGQNSYMKNDSKILHINGLEGGIYLFANVFCIFYYFIPLIWIFHYKHWYIIKQRNFILTFIGGIANFISTFSNLITQILNIPCAVSYYSATVATAFMQLCFVNRAIRLIFLYKLNIFKVTELSQKKFIQKSQKNTVVEPNIYYKSIYKMVNKRIAYITTIILMLISLVISIVFHVMTERNINSNYVICGLKPININQRINEGNHSDHYGFHRRDNKIKDKDIYGNLMGSAFSMFMLPIYFGIVFTVICIIIAIIFTVTNIKDDQKFGIKFDCFSNAIVSAIAEMIYIAFFFLKNNQEFLQHDNIFTRLFKNTKEGILLFILVGFYLHLTSVIIPLYKCIKAERLDKYYENEPTNTMQYFYKILNSPNLVEELKSIAIQEFVVENVLFWENYCILQRLVTRAKHKQNIGEIDSSSYSYHGKISLQDIYSQNSGISHDEDSYDPNYPLLPQLVPYFNAFYHTFIDIDGPAAVNISGSTVRRIYHDFYTYPTVGIFDEAKDEVVESMYLTIFPILLQQNRKQLGDVYSQN